ncbi:MAG: hypothetical protein AN483_01740 [Aphanizomenon flos-aquae MDT14a]|jgi:para-aminobenzoate synthetase/4-amino-4-deoxychorismate lyase|nr:MAG: hypothetical protein AN483_01740 [Aphanizomenon flos-aquae MDT14a]
MKNQLNQPNFSLLETILWQPNDGYFVLDHHLKRLQSSAIYFDFPVNINSLKTQLEQSTQSFLNQAYKIRFLLNSHGNMTYQIMALSSTNHQEFVKLSICHTPVDSSNIFLYHKTSNRQVYEIAKATFPDFDDVLLWNERGEITETCVGNIVVNFHEKLLTPPVKCGLLPGTFRADLLEKGKIREEVITVEQLKSNNGIYIINSVRKWREAILISG